MAKDILVNTNSGDFIPKSWDKKVEYYDTVWGKLLDTDTDDILYLNIIIPYRKASQVSYDANGEYSCKVHVDYYGEAKSFFVRLVSRSNVIGKYIDLHLSNQKCPNSCECKYRQTFMDMPKPIYASQLQIININGYYQVQFKRYKGGNIERSFIYQADDIDFEIGNGDNQSAQLLARCAPGKYYRYPTSGVDLTKYIGSVVEHSDLKEKLSDEFDRDNKNISEASFDNENGNLEILFTSANEADDKNLDDVNKLDIELLRVADDDYIRSLYKAAQGLLTDNEGFRSDILDWSGMIVGMWDVGGECQLDKLPYSFPMTYNRIRFSGLEKDLNMGYEVGVWSDIKPGVLYAVDYVGVMPEMHLDSGNHENIKYNYFYHDPLFMVQTSDGRKYVDEDYRIIARSGVDNIDCKNYYNNPNRKLFMALEPCTAYCYIGTNTSDGNTSESGGGLKIVSDKRGNYASVLALAVHPKTGKMYGIITYDSDIEEVIIEKDTNRLLVIKQSK